MNIKPCNKVRKRGYYWVQKWSGAWDIMFYDNYWWQTGDDTPFVATLFYVSPKPIREPFKHSKPSKGGLTSSEKWQIITIVHTIGVARTAKLLGRAKITIYNYLKTLRPKHGTRKT